MNQSPFSYNAPPSKPLVLKPLVYCEFRVSSGDFQDRMVNVCDIFASAVVEEMTFCSVHAEVILIELAKEVGNGGSDSSVG